MFQLQSSRVLSKKDRLRLLDLDEAELRLKQKLKQNTQVAIKVEDKTALWRERPDLFAIECLGISLTEAQISILNSVKNNRRTAVKSYHSLGKTISAAVALLWWIYCWDAHIGYITAPTWKAALGKPFKQAKRLALKNKLGFEILNSGIIRDKDVYKATERFIEVLNAESGEGFQGEHTAPMLIVLEESIDVPPYIFEAANALMTDSDCRILEIANPTDESTPFGDHCSSPNYEVLSFSALNDPNVLAELYCQPTLFKGLSLQWLFEMFRDETEVVEEKTVNTFEFYSLEVMKKALNGTPVDEQSPKCFYHPTSTFQSRVLGEFPTEVSNKVIPFGWLKNLPPLEIDLSHKIQIGCDVARFGDDRTTIFGRIGGCVLFGIEVKKFDGLEVARVVKDCAERLVRNYSTDEHKIIAKQIEIAIDVTGGLGTAPFDLLKAESYKVVGINSATTASNRELFKNKRSELWFAVRERLVDQRIDFSRLDLEMRRKLFKELSTPTYKSSTSGQKIVQEKAEIKKDLKASPDLADGLNLAFYEIGQSSGVMTFHFRI